MEREGAGELAGAILAIGRFAFVAAVVVFYPIVWSGVLISIVLGLGIFAGGGEIQDPIPLIGASAASATIFILHIRFLRGRSSAAGYGSTATGKGTPNPCSRRWRL